MSRIGRTRPCCGCGVGVEQRRGRRFGALLTILTCCSLTFAAGATASVTAATVVRSRAPSTADYAAISRAYHADRRLGWKFRAHSRIIEIRETIGPRPLARVVFTGTGAFAATGSGSGGWGEVFSAFYFKPTGEWKADGNVSKKVAARLKTVPAWNVRYVGSGTETKNGSSPGEVQKNPYCGLPAAVEKGWSQFNFSAGWRLNVDSTMASGVGDVKGTGTDEIDQQPGCVGMQGAVAPQSTHCSVAFKSSWPDSNFYGQLSGAVDSRSNHELRLRMSTVLNDPPLCSAPAVWEHDADGPIAYEHSILVPDGRLARGSVFTTKVAIDKALAPVDCLFGYPDVTCNRQLTWKATISFSPLKLPKLKNVNFSGPAPDASFPAGGVSSRG